MKKIFLIASILYFPFFLSSQSNICSKWYFGADYNLATPLEDLRFNGFGVNHGVNFDLLYHGGKLDGIQFQSGIRLTAGVSRGRTEEFDLDIPVDPIPTGESTVRNTMGDLKFIGRLVTDQNKKFKAYLEGFVGFRVTGVTRNIDILDNNNPNNVIYDRLSTQVTTVTGLHAGFLIGVSEDVDINIRGGVERSNSVSHFDIVSDP